MKNKLKEIIVPFIACSTDQVTSGVVDRWVIVKSPTNELFCLPEKDFDSKKKFDGEEDLAVLIVQIKHPYWNIAPDEQSRADRALEAASDELKIKYATDPKAVAGVIAIGR